MDHTYYGVCECFDCSRHHSHYKSTTDSCIYDVRSSHIVSLRTGLKSNQFEIDLPLSIPFQQAAAAYTCKMGRALVRLAVYQSITMIRRMIRVQTLMYGL